MSNVTLRQKSGSEWKLYPSPYVETFLFPGGEPHVNLTNEFGEQWLPSNVWAIDLRFNNNNDLITALVINDMLRRRGAEKVYLLCPYLPGARQDRGEPLTAKVYADMINSAGLDAVVGLDPHSDVMPALINNYRNANFKALWIDALRGKDFSKSDAALVIPDQGAGKRVETIAGEYGYRTIQGFKHRDFSSGKLSGFTLDKIPDDVSTLVIVDDICDGGGTFMGLANVIRAMRPDIHINLIVTHGIFSKGFKELEREFTFVWTTDSIPQDSRRHYMLKVVPCLNVLLAKLR